jgi:glutathione S-transferase
MLAPPELKKAHALGKSPVLSITPVGSDKPIVLAETGFITQYLAEHFGQGTTLVPRRYGEGQEGKVGGETEEWLRYQYFLYYSEGSFMPNLILSIIVGALKGNKVPFFIRPITAMVANQISATVLLPNVKTHLEFLENQLATSEGDYFCGKNLTAADIATSFGLISAKDKFKDMGSWEAPPETLFPKVWAYIDMMDAQPGYKKSAEKIKEIDDSFGIKF